MPRVIGQFDFKLNRQRTAVLFNENTMAIVKPDIHVFDLKKAG